MRTRPTALLTAVAGLVLAVTAACGTAQGSAQPATTPTAPSPTGAPSTPVVTPAPTGTVTVPGLGTPTTSSPAPTSTAASKSSTPSSRTSATRSTPASTRTPSPISTPTATPTTTPTPTPPASTSASSTSAPQGTGPLAGKVVVIDPGHNGANAEHPEIINKQVPAGFGEYKNCNTTGTQTNAGYPEYRFNWGVATRLQALLQAKGITVVMTRHSDDGVGPCVNVRAEIGNDAHADAVVSIHGDGDESSAHGFYVMTSQRAPAGAAMAGLSGQLQIDVRNGLEQAGLSPSNHLGSAGLWQRSDLAGLNLSLRPTVMVECGNMRNASDAALMSSAAGQQQIAQGFADGVIAYLRSH